LWGYGFGKIGRCQVLDRYELLSDFCTQLEHPLLASDHIRLERLLERFVAAEKPVDFLHNVASIAKHILHFLVSCF